MIPRSLEGRPSFPDQLRDAAPFDPLDVATLVVFGALFGIATVAGVTIVLARAGASLIDRLASGSDDGSRS